LKLLTCLEDNFEVAKLKLNTQIKQESFIFFL
jgi:hypothetical protein